MFNFLKLQKLLQRFIRGQKESEIFMEELGFSIRVENGALLIPTLLRAVKGQTLDQK